MVKAIVNHSLQRCVLSGKLLRKISEGLREYPTIEFGHEVVTLGSGDKGTGQNEIALAVFEPQQELAGRSGGSAIQRNNALLMQDKLFVL